MLGSFELDIPPGEKHYLVTDSYELPVDVDALSIYPHAHYLGKEIQGIATLPDGTRQWLIRINDWDFNWQDEYRFAEPVFLPKGTTVTMQWVYDNSASNPQNPNRPPQRVVYGSKSTDEMSDLVVQVLPRDRNDLEILERDFARASYEKEINRQVRQHYGIGRALASQGKFDEAIGHYREAIQLRSDDARVLIAMARAFASKGDLDGANLIADRAIQLGGQDDPVVLDGLAAVYAAAGDTDRAVNAAEQAIRLASSTGDDQLADEIRQNLERYRQGKPD
jgi:tetratricopeptide (TPR) repeat protein